MIIDEIRCACYDSERMEGLLVLLGKVSDFMSQEDDELDYTEYFYDMAKSLELALSFQKKCSERLWKLLDESSVVKGQGGADTP